MSSFTEPLIVKKLKGRMWEVTRSFDYYVGEENSNDKITVSKGFITDFASVPRPFWIVVPPDGQYSQAAVLHDYLYRMQKVGRNRRSRKECDQIFLEAMSVLNVPLWKRRIMYRAVRMFGWIPW